MLVWDFNPAKVNMSVGKTFEDSNMFDNFLFGGFVIGTDAYHGENPPRRFLEW